MDPVTLGLAKSFVNNTLRIPVTNLVKNGNFAEHDGIIGTGWQHGSSITGLSVAGGVQYFTGAGQIGLSVARHFYNPSTTMDASHTYYVSVTAKRVSGSGGTIYCGSAYQDFLPTGTGGSLTDDWRRYSGTGVGRPQINGRFTIGASEGVTVAVTNALCLDLTAIFGAGYEPTAQQVDALLAQFDGGWFDGQEFLFDPAHVLAILFAELSDLRNALLSLGGGA